MIKHGIIEDVNDKGETFIRCLCGKNMWKCGKLNQVDFSIEELKIIDAEFRKNKPNSKLELAKTNIILRKIWKKIKKHEKYENEIMGFY